MAALQQSPVAFQSKSPPSHQITARALTHKPIRLSFIASFPSLKIPKLTSKLLSKSKRGGGAGGAVMSDTAASRYATALAEVASTNGTLEATSQDIEKVEKIFAEPGVYEFFLNPTVDIEKKFQTVEEIAKGAELKPTTLNFLNILVDVKRIDQIKNIIKEFELVYNTMTDTELAIVTSVVKLESQHLAQIAKGVQRLTGSKNVRIKTQLDPSLVAGFTIRYGNSGSKLIDMSVKKQLQELATQLDFSDIELAAAV